MKKLNENLFSTAPSVLRKAAAAMLCGVMAGVFFVTGCKKDEGKKDSESRVYYVAGYDASSGVVINVGTAKAGGYLFVSEDLKDTLYASNVTELDNGLLKWDVHEVDELFIFPEEIMPTNICWFNFFPDEYRFSYKIQMSYRPMTEEEALNTLHACNTAYYVPYPNLQPERIVIKSISKI
jgi:hypothetical protein